MPALRQRHRQHPQAKLTKVWPKKPLVRWETRPTKPLRRQAGERGQPIMSRQDQRDPAPPPHLRWTCWHEVCPPIAECHPRTVDSDACTADASP